MAGAESDRCRENQDRYWVEGFLSGLTGLLSFATRNVVNSITVHTLEIPVRLGCSAEERAFPQKVLFDIEMFFDFSKCLESDEISDTVDYFPIVRALQQSCGDRQWKMIEKLAWDAAQLVLLQSERIEQVRITATKNILAGSKGFSATVICRREDGSNSLRSS